MCWDNWQDHINTKRNYLVLTTYYTFSEPPDTNRTYWDFDFSENSSSRFRRKYFIQVHRQPDCIYVYFRTENQTEKERIALRDLIINNLGQLINDNGWTFRLEGCGRRLGNGNIRYRIVNEDLTPIDDYQTMIDIMILIADNLQAIEAGEPIVNGSGKEKTDERFPENIKNNIPDQAENTPVSVRRQTDVQMLPRCESGKSFKDFFNFSLDLHDGTLPVSKFASWACWTAANIKDNTNLQFPCEVNEEFLNTVNANIIFVGLNISRDIREEWSNFHTSPNDARLRWAIQNNELFRKAYMTDLIKGLPNSSSEYVKGYFQENEPRKPYRNKKNKMVGKERYDGFLQRKQDIKNQTFVSLKEHGDNFREEMKLLESIQDKQKPIVLILLGTSMESDFLRPMFRESESLKKWKDELGERLIVKSIQHFAARNRPGESESAFRERYCEELRAISNELSPRFHA